MSHAKEEVLSLLNDVLKGSSKPLSLHEPELDNTDLEYVTDCVKSGWVSSVGQYVDEFERKLEEITGAKRAVAVCNGTAALHICLKMVSAGSNDEVLLPALTFVATANAVAYTGATPHFVDVDKHNMGVDPIALKKYLSSIGEVKARKLINHQTKRHIKALIVMHAFGHPCDMQALSKVCEDFHIELIEDAAESLGSYYKGTHTGTLSAISALSFNGNKIITTGSGGAILVNNLEVGKEIKHITTTAKVPHRWAFEHDEIGYNYRLSNLSASLGCAQLSRFDDFLKRKRLLADRYKTAAKNYHSFYFSEEPQETKSNYWLNNIILKNTTLEELDQIIGHCHENGYLVRPIWKPMHQLKMYQDCPRMPLPNTDWLATRVISLPSHPRLVGVRGAL